jgi:5-methylcytosine-specific restriction enzyme A
MAQGPKHRCIYPGCGVLLEYGAGSRCPAHRAASDERKQTRKGKYDHDWQKLRDAKLAQDPFCEIRTHCQGAVAELVDHKIPTRLRPDLRLAPENLQSSCKPCHAAKTAREQRGEYDVDPDSIPPPKYTF